MNFPISIPSAELCSCRANLAVFSILKYVTDMDEVKGLCFCISIEYAEFMCCYFSTTGFPLFS